jgi:hypothetical protein
MSALCQSRLNAPQQTASLFDHLVGAALAAGRRVRRVRIRPPNPFFEDLLRRGRLKLAKTAKTAAEARDAKVRDATSK